MKHGKKRDSGNDALPARVRPFTVGRKVILTLDTGTEIETSIRSKPKRWPGGSYRVQVVGRIAWYNVNALRVDTSKQLELLDRVSAAGGVL